MKLNTLQKVLLLVMMMLMIITVPKYSFAGQVVATQGEIEEPPQPMPEIGGALSPSQIIGDSNIDLNTSFIDTITDFISKIGAFIAVGVMMIMGIKYMTGSLEEKATYKKSMIAYVTGCFLLFGASIIAPKVVEIFSDLGDNTQDIGNKILGIIQVVGSLIAVGVLMIIGLKYMIGSAEEKASYKKTMIPYLVGAVLLFGAVNITTAIYDVTMSVEGSGKEASNRYLNGLMSGYSDKTPQEQAQIKEQLQSEYDKALEKRNQAAKENPDSDEAKYWKEYTFQIYETLKWL